MKFSELLHEALCVAEPPLTAEQMEAAQASIVELLQGWVAIHEPDLPEDQLIDPQRALVLMLMEELDDRAEIPIVS